MIEPEYVPPDEIWRLSGTLQRVDGRYYYIFTQKSSGRKIYKWDWTFWTGYRGEVFAPGPMKPSDHQHYAEKR